VLTLPCIMFVLLILATLALDSLILGISSVIKRWERGGEGERGETEGERHQLSPTHHTLIIHYHHHPYYILSIPTLPRRLIDIHAYGYICMYQNMYVSMYVCMYVCKHCNYAPPPFPTFPLSHVGAPPMKHVITHCSTVY
jgi:hypothetical protein